MTMPSDNKELPSKIMEIIGKNTPGEPLRLFSPTKIEALIADQCRLARRKETKLYEDWCNNDTTTHIEDFIEYRVKSLEE